MLTYIKSLLPTEFKIALSGGVDSIACAHFLLTLGKRFTAVHYNHNQRPQNFEMEVAVASFCEDFNIPLVTGTCYEKVTRDVENTLRGHRVNFFSSVGGNIVTCHHMSDVIESYMLNCLAGKPEYKPIPEYTPFNTFKFFRPFILSEKSDISLWAYKHGLEKYIVADETNDDNRYDRNWLRNVIIPQIQERKPLRKTMIKKYYSHLK